MEVRNSNVKCLLYDDDDKDGDVEHTRLISYLENINYHSSWPQIWCIRFSCALLLSLNPQKKCIYLCAFLRVMCVRICSWTFQVPGLACKILRDGHRCTYSKTFKMLFFSAFWYGVIDALCVAQNKIFQRTISEKQFCIIRGILPYFYEKKTTYGTIKNPSFSVKNYQWQNSIYFESQHFIFWCTQFKHNYSFFYVNKFHYPSISYGSCATRWIKYVSVCVYKWSRLSRAWCFKRVSKGPHFLVP